MYEVLKKIKRIEDALFGEKDYIQFVIVCQARTGSNLLMSLLNSHPEVRALGEEFSLMSNKTTTQKIKAIFPPKAVKKIVGFKIFYYHPLDSNDLDIWEYLRTNKNIKIIHLTRQNTLRTFLSRKIAFKTKKWRDTKVIPREKKKTFLDREEFDDFAARTMQYEQATRKSFAEHDYMEISYEQLVKNKRTVLPVILRFLKASKDLDLWTPMVKQNPEDLADLIINYEDFKDIDQSFHLRERKLTVI